MRRRVALGAAAMTAVVACSTVGGSAAFAERVGAQSIASDIDAILTDPSLAGAVAGVSVVDAATGASVYDRLSRTRFVPASNNKLFTSTAAVELLGADYRFTTDVRVDGTRDGAVVRGDLVLRGTGDPTMLAADYDRLAADVAAAGITSVRGNIVTDDTFFDSVRLGSDWGWDDEPFYYAAQVSALTVSPNTDYNAGSVIVEVTPGATAGAAPTVKVTPDNGYLRIENRATTVASGGANTVSADRRHGANNIVITGGVPAGGAAARLFPSVWEPTGLAADLFSRALTARGVVVGGSVKLGGVAPAGATVVATHQSMPLSQLLIPFLKLSNNNHAEVLTKAVGRKVSGAGTYDAGLAAITSYVRGTGVEADAYRQYDGSGLSRRDLTTPGGITKLLVSAQSEPWFATWRESLPIAGDPDRMKGGTLANRMRNTPAAGNVRAKTGTLPGVSVLSGYVTDASGRKLVFSIMVNSNIVSANAVQDRIAVALAGGTAAAQAAAADAVKRRQQPQSAELECSWLLPATC